MAEREREPGIALVAERVRVLLGDGWEVRSAERGISTPVYRLSSNGNVLYLRLSETSADSPAPEVRVLTVLSGRGVKVPEVVHYEPFDDVLGRSAMVTTEVRGVPLDDGGPPESLRVIAQEAGRDLATINSLPIEGFGWIRRDRPPDELAAEHVTPADFAAEYFDALARLARLRILTRDEADRIGYAMHSYASIWRHGWLAHGDLDATHIFQHDGRYSGIIDFGEIRGAHPLYDLGHFLLHDGESLPLPLFADLLSGYTEVSSLSSDDELHVRAAALMIGVRALDRCLGRPSFGAYRDFLLARVRHLQREV